MTLRGVTNNIIEFRRVGIAPLSALAENGRGVSLGVASTILSPCDSEHACSFHASHRFGEALISDAHRYRDEDERGVDGSMAIVVWLVAAILLCAGGIGWVVT